MTRLPREGGAITRSQTISTSPKTTAKTSKISVVPKAKKMDVRANASVVSSHDHIGSLVSVSEKKYEGPGAGVNSIRVPNEPGRTLRPRTQLQLSPSSAAASQVTPTSNRTASSSRVQRVSPSKANPLPRARHTSLTRASLPLIQSHPQRNVPRNGIALPVNVPFPMVNNPCPSCGGASCSSEFRLSSPSQLCFVLFGSAPHESRLEYSASSFPECLQFPTTANGAGAAHGSAVDCDQRVVSTP